MRTGVVVGERVEWGDRCQCGPSFILSAKRHSRGAVMRVTLL